MSLFTFNICSAQIKNIDSLIQVFYNEWKDVPYRYGGNSKKGIDCSKFTKQFYQQVYGMEIPPTCSKQYGSGIPVSLDSIQPGDLIYFVSKVSPSGWHCGVYIGGGEFMHAANYRDGIKISCIFDPHYNRLLRGVRKFVKP